MRRKADDTKKSKVTWTSEEDETLLKAVSEDQQNRSSEDEEDWDEIAKALPDKSPVHCLKRYMVLSEKKDSENGSVEAPEEETESPSPANKKAKTQATVEEQATVHWSNDEVALLRKLVEQYNDSK